LDGIDDLNIFNIKSHYDNIQGSGFLGCYLVQLRIADCGVQTAEQSMNINKKQKTKTRKKQSKSQKQQLPEKNMSTVLVTSTTVPIPVTLPSPFSKLPAKIPFK
jgi:hypothetical protein